jgi:hypothetical protein
MLRLHVHVIAIRLPSPQDEAPAVASDLLPWADPYIAALIRRLARHDEDEPAADEPLAALEDDLWDPLADDAFAPPAEERLTVLRPVVGGYPLLDAPPRTEQVASADWENSMGESVRRPR